MPYLSHIREWVRGLLVRPRTAGRSGRVRGAHATPDRPTPPASEQGLPISPVMMSAWLVLARLRRARRAAQNDQGEAHPLVPMYVLPPRPCQPALLSRELKWTGR